MQTSLTSSDIADRAAVFIDAVAAAIEPTDAARLAGFDDPQAARRLLQQPAIRKALIGAASARLEAEALPLALAAVVRILADPRTPPAVAAKLSLGVLDRAGVGAKAEVPANAPKDMENMSTDELEAYIAQRADKAVALEPTSVTVTKD